MSTRTSSRPRSRRTGRKILKVATLGIAGLVAGFLAGCSSSDAAARYSTWREGDPNTLTATRRLENLDYRRTPEIRRAPVLHRNQPATPPRPSTTAYAFVGEIDAAGHHYVAPHSGGQ